MERLRSSDCYASFGPSFRRQGHVLAASSTSSSTNNSQQTSLAETSETTIPSIDRSQAAEPGTSHREVSTKAAGITIDSGGRLTTSTAAPISLTNHLVNSSTRSSCAKWPSSQTTYQSRNIRQLPASKSISLDNASSEVRLYLEKPDLKGLRTYISRTRHLLSSCCLVDSGDPTYPVVATTDGRISRHIDLNVSGSQTCENSQNFLIQTVPDSQSKRVFQIVKRTVTRRSTESVALVMIARVDITGLLASDGFSEQIDDIWLNVAADEMRGALFDRPHLRKYIPETEFLHLPWNLIPSIQQIGTFYDSFFIIEPSPFPGSYEVTHCSSTNSASKASQLTRIAHGINTGHYRLARLLTQGYRFIFDARIGTDGTHEMVWCLPLRGNGLKCWICFLLDSVA